MKCKYYEWKKNLCFFISSIIFVLIFSTSTSPLYHNYWGGDSAIFQVIGKAWNDGIVPYMQLFDHKGPFIFFVDALGYRIGGIWIIQSIFLSITVLGIYDMTKAFELSEKARVAITLFSLVALSIFYSNGNLTEEYCLPFLSWSLSKEVAYLRGRIKIHKPQYALLYGMTFSVCLLTRITNAVPICFLVLVIAIWLIINKEWKNLSQNIFMFLLGCVVMTMPFILYFILHECLEEAIYGTLLYNFEYLASEKSVFFDQLTLKTSLVAIVNYSIVLGVLLVGGWKLLKNRLLGIAYLVVGGASLYLDCLSGQSYLHYAMVILPLNVIPLAEILENKVKDWKKQFCIITYSVAVAMGILWNGRLFVNNYLLQELNGSISEYKPLSEVILEQIPQEERDSIVGYNIPVSTYLSWEITPCYTYFHHQDWQGEKSDTLMSKIQDEYETCQAKWIIAPNGKNGISSILDANYKSVFEYEADGIRYNLFCRNGG